MRLTPMGRAVVGATVALFAIAVVNDSRAVHVIASAGLGLVAICFVLAWGAARGLNGSARLAGRWASAGGVARLEVKVANSGRRARGPLLVELSATNHTVELPPLHVAHVLAIVSPEEELTCTVAIPCPARGWYRLSAVSVGAEDPLGLFVRRLRLSEEAELLALPRSDHLASMELGREEQRRHARRRATQVGDGSEYRGVREYVPGDELRRVHWPTTARLGRLAVREMEQTWSGAAAVLLDLHDAAHRGAGLESTVEATVYAAASLVRTVIEGGGSCLLAARGDRRVAHSMDRGAAHQQRILADLADVRAEGALGFVEFLEAEARGVPAGCTLFLVTATEDARLATAVARMLGQMASVHVVHVSGPQSAPGDERAARALRQRLTALGAQVTDLRADEAAEELANVRWAAGPAPAWGGGAG